MNVQRNNPADSFLRQYVLMYSHVQCVDRLRPCFVKWHRGVVCDKMSINGWHSRITLWVFPPVNLQSSPFQY